MAIISKVNLLVGIGLVVAIKTADYKFPMCPVDGNRLMPSTMRLNNDIGKCECTTLPNASINTSVIQCYFT